MVGEILSGPRAAETMEFHLFSRLGTEINCLELYEEHLESTKKPLLTCNHISECTQKTIFMDGKPSFFFAERL